MTLRRRAADRAAYRAATTFTSFAARNTRSIVPDDSDPIWRDNAFQPDGSRRVLRKPSQRRLHVSRTPGLLFCLLEVRPLICRIYPYDYDAGGLLDDSGARLPAGTGAARTWG